VKTKSQSVRAILIIVILLLSSSVILSTNYFSFSPNLAVGQPEAPLPVLLIHGYRSTHEVWNGWVDRLGDYGIEAKAITFEDDTTTAINEDECGSAKDHAAQLNQLVRNFKEETRSEKINIVTHSKGGLDARLYLANNPFSADVANLIMIGTPNEGSPIADRYYPSDDCKPAVYDLRTTSSAVRAERNEHTAYSTIAGDWISIYGFNVPSWWDPYWWVAEDLNCPNPSIWFDLEGWNFLGFQHIGRNEIPGPNDGIVPVDSVEEPGEFVSLGRTDNCHTNMFTEEEFDKALAVLME
jgi:pimeloyl-ACP methyl ester carboxylesterase